ncbi:glycosyltransferase [Agarivorans sp. TSD2052]|uniref:glycosyltransferase n=1 Tax=Agarivorans sp. TSD2052 TaxID=2937286 RepID=UPI00200F9989|nr:glycosyltransferase [Agarivorans sp. TSD2052]UPW18271.1 glycosyltransferase [Agarivorans sp. TSD2052]
MESKKEPRDVLVVYHYIAKYREPIFNAMLDNSSFHIAADIQGNSSIELIDKEFYSNANFIRLRNVWLSRSILWQIGLINKVVSNRYKTVIFLGDPYFLSTWVSLVISKLYGKKTILWTHGFIRSGGFKDKVKLLMYKLADALFLYGDAAKTNLVNKGLSSSKLFTIFNSVDYFLQRDIANSIDNSSLRLLKNQLFHNSGLFQLVFVGRLTKQKKLTDLVYLLSNLKDKGVFVNLLFIGDGEEREEIEKLAISMSLNKQICFYGKTYNEVELAYLISSSDLCVAPGEVGLTAMHVMGYGVPVITHDSYKDQMPEYESIVVGKTGLLFEYGSFDSMVNTVENYICDPIPNVKENCLDIIESKYTATAQMSVVMASIEKVLS